MLNLETERRLTRLEAESEDRDRRLARMEQKLDDIHDAFNQAKGAKWMLVALATVGGAIAGFATKFLPWTATFPK